MDQQNKYKPAKLYFEEYTPDDCDPSLPPIIFIHGFGSLHSSWNTVWKQIAEETDRKVLSIELRNHGKSEWNDYFTMELLIEDLDNFLTENGIKRCVIIGHSLGARAGLYLALRKPELVECIVAEETSLQNASDEQQTLVKTLFSFVNRVKMLPKNMSVHQVRKLVKDMITAKFPGNSIANLAFYMPLRQDPDGNFEFEFNISALTRSLDDFSNFALSPEQYDIFHGRALFIYAENSVAKVEEDKLIPEKFPNAELCKFNSTGHVLHVDCGPEYIKKICTFIRN